MGSHADQIVTGDSTAGSGAPSSATNNPSPPPGPKTTTPAPGLDEGPPAKRQKQVYSYGAFLSHRGPDAKWMFVEALETELLRRNPSTRVFVDKNMEPGSTLSAWETIVNALRGARVVVVVLSEDFQTSPWCLEELRFALALPANGVGAGEARYRVVYQGKGKRGTPNDEQLAASLKVLREDAQLNAEAPADDPELLRIWRDAITATGNNTYLSYDPTASSTATAVNKVADNVLKVLQRPPLSETRGIFGLDDQVAALQNLVTSAVVPSPTPGTNVSKEPETPPAATIGILGMGGIGKTTLAKKFFDHLLAQGDFKRTCFIENLSEVTMAADIARMQRKLLADLADVTTDPKSLSNGKKMLVGVTEKNKMLVLLDDLTDATKLDDFIDLTKLGPGSVAILTSRSRQALTNEGRESSVKVYLTQTLPMPPAKQLLQYCFTAPDPPPPWWEQFLDTTVQRCYGLPISLKVVGSMIAEALSDKAGTKTFCDDLLNKLKGASPMEAIANIMHVSYQELSSEERDLFLDIACNLNGWPAEAAKAYWAGIGMAASGLTRLMTRSLLASAPEGSVEVLEMHNQMRHLGRNIEAKLTENEGGRLLISNRPKPMSERQRVWTSDDVLKALTTGKPCAQLRMARLEERELPSPLVFPEGNGLQVLEVLNCTMKAPGATLSEFEHLDDLRHLSLSKCGGFTAIGELPQNPVLTSLPESIGIMTELLRLDLSGCASLAGIPDACFTGLGKLQHLDLSGCSKLTKLPDSLGDLTSLVTLDLSGCEQLQELPAGMEELMLLETLDLSFCSALTALPGCIVGTLEELKTQGTLPLMSSPDLRPDGTDAIPQAKWETFQDLYKKLAKHPYRVVNTWLREQADKTEAYDALRSSPKGLGTALHDLDVQRKQLKNFWEYVVKLIEKRALPADTLAAGGEPLQLGEETRLLLEPLDIANYYRLKLWRSEWSGFKHYLEDNNRPSGYPVLEAAWLAAHPGDTEHEHVTDKARQEQQHVEDMKKQLEELNAAVAALQPGATPEALRRVSIAADAAIEASRACKLFKTGKLAEDLARVAKGANGGNAALLGQVRTFEKKLQHQFLLQDCENTES